MRIIKFRGKKKQTGEWLYGDLLNAIDDGAEIIGNAHDNPELLEKYMTIEIKQSER